MEWIRCEDAMPENDTPVLIFSTHAWRRGNIVCTAMVNEYGWQVIGASGPEYDNAFDTPTHWMPLPQGPRQEK